MRASLCRLLLIALVLLAAGPAWAFLEPGERIGEWEVTDAEQHPEYLRVWFAGPDGKNTGVEIVEDRGRPGDWSTGRHRLMPAPNEEPPPFLLVAVMERLRAYDAAQSPALTDPIKRPIGPIERPTTRTSSRPGQREVDPRMWTWLFGALGLITVTARWWVPRVREPLARVDAWVERLAWPLLAGLLLAVGSWYLRDLGQAFDADALTQRLFFSTLDFDAIARHEYADMRHPPLYYLVLHLVLRFGHDEALVRLPAALFGLGAIAALFAMVRPALGTWRALAIASLLALNLSFLRHSREVADITLFIFLLLTSTALILAYLRDPERRWLLVPVVGLETAMFYTYYMAPLAAVAQLIAIASYGRRVRHLWLAVLAVGAASWPLVDKMRRLTATDSEIRGLARLFPQHHWGDTGPLEILSQWANLMAPGELSANLLLVLGLMGVLRIGVKRPLGVWSIALVTVSTALMAWAVVVVRLKAYYMLFLFPALAIVAVVGGLGHPDEPEPEERVMGPLGVGAGLSAVILLLAASVADFYERAPEVVHPTHDRSWYAELGAMVKEREDHARTLVADPNALHTLLLYYAFEDPIGMYRTCELPGDGSGTRCIRGEDRLYTLTAAPAMSDGWELRSLERLRAIEATGETWVVYTVRFPNQPLVEHLQQTCEQTQTWAANQIELWSCPQVSG